MPQTELLMLPPVMRMVASPSSASKPPTAMMPFLFGSVVTEVKVPPFISMVTSPMVPTGWYSPVRIEPPRTYHQVPLLISIL